MPCIGETGGGPARGYTPNQTRNRYFAGLWAFDSYDFFPASFSIIVLGAVRLLLFAFVFLSAGPALAHVYLEANLSINILPGRAVTDRQLFDLVDGVNDLYAQCGNLSFTPIEIDRLAAAPNFTALNQNNEIDVNNSILFMAAHPHIEHGGFKIFLADGVRSGGRLVDGWTDRGHHATYLSKQNGALGDATTWAHEIGHGLGLVGDGKTPDSLNPNNVMYKSRLLDNGQPAPSDKFTDEQCETIRSNFSKMAPVAEVTVDQLHVTPDDTSKDSVLVSMPATDQATGMVAEAPDYLAVQGADFLFTRYPEPQQVAILLHLMGRYPENENISATYTVLLDTDNDETTGVSADGYQGMNIAIVLDVQGRSPFTTGNEPLVATVRDLVTATKIASGRGIVATREVQYYDAEDDEVVVEKIRDYIAIYVPRIKVMDQDSALGSDGAMVETLAWEAGVRASATGFDQTLLTISTSAT